MMLYLPKDEFKQMPTLKKNPNIKIGKNNTVYKFVIDIDRKFTKYITTLPEIDGFIGPIDLLYDEYSFLYGYSMPQIKRSYTINEMFGKEDQIDVLHIIKQIFSILEELHNYFIYGDIRNTNFLIKNNKVFFIDWDAGKRLDNPKVLNTYYKPYVGKYYYDDNFTPRDIKVLKENKLTDHIKAFISSLSLMYGINIENYVKYNNLNSLYEALKSIKADKIVLHYLEHLITLVNIMQEDVDYSFEDCISLVRLPSDRQKKKLARIIS